MKARLWCDDAHRGSWNMAIDWAMLEYASLCSSIILRVYTWRTPTVSLGYFQRWEELQAYPSLVDLDCVRRVTGGGAIVHDREWTYSIAIPDSLPQKGHSEELYRSLHQAVAAWLSQQGFPTILWEASPERQPNGPDTQVAFLCFQRRSDVDLVFRSHKILGSAQRRTRDGLLQHGSLLLSASPHTPSLAGLLEPNMEADAKDRLDFVTEKNGLGPKRFHAEGFVKALQSGFESSLELVWEEFSPTEELLARATKIENERFGNSDWTRFKMR